VWQCSFTLEKPDAGKMNIEALSEANIEVKADQETGMEVGGKLSLAINPERKEMRLKPNSSEQVNWVIKVGDNLTVSSLGDRSQDSSPRVKFFDDKGKLLASTTARYT
jgi:hypothetical protein